MRSRRTAFALGVTAIAGATAFQRIRSIIQKRNEQTEENSDSSQSDYVMIDVTVENTDDESSHMKEGYQMLSLNNEIYSAVIDVFGEDASIKSNVLDESGIEPFDETSTDEYRPTVQLTDSSRWIIDSGTASSITRTTITNLVDFRQSGYRRLIVVPEEDEEQVQSMIDDMDASVDVCTLTQIYDVL